MNTTTRRLALGYVALLALATGAIACAAPSVGISRAGITKVTTTGLRVMLDLAVSNPNQYELPVRQVSWNLGLFGAEVTRGATAQNSVVPAGGRGAVRVPVGVRFETIGNLYQKLVSSRSIPWSVAGQVNFQTPVGPFFVKFADSGSWRNPITSAAAPARTPAVTATLDVDAVQP